MMIQEAYVSLELAKMMAKAGFTDRCRCYYLGDDAMRWTHDCQEILPKDVPVYECPTQQMACEWLRQVGAYHIEVRAAYHFRVFDGYTFEVFSLFSNEYVDYANGKGVFPSVPEAYDDAIRFCLERLPKEK